MKPPTTLRNSFVEAMSRAACTVSLVTTDGAAGRAGVTVTAMSSVSADGPAPRLLICLHRDGRTCGKILRNRVFCVNVLRDRQTDIADIFAGRGASDSERRRVAADWLPMTTGAPRLRDPLAAFDCRIVQAQLCGSHYVIFGSVGDVHVAGEDAALVHANRHYSSLSACPARPVVYGLSAWPRSAAIRPAP